jgi:4-alpha-glucanotransferase
VSNSTSQHSLLHQLAEAAGLAVHWQNYRNEDRLVAPDTLRDILHALGIPAGSEAQCQDSLHQLQEESARRIPGLLITRVGRRLSLPPSLQSTLKNVEKVLLHPEKTRPAKSFHEKEHQISVSVERVAGEYNLVPPQQPGYYNFQLGEHNLSLAVAPERCTSVSDLTGKSRTWGVSAQLYSMRRPGDGGIGDFSALKQFAVGMARAGAAGVAISPVHALFSADHSRFSPYAPSSRLFNNVLHIDPAQTFAAELVKSCLHRMQLQEARDRVEQANLIDWPEAARLKLGLLRCLWEQSQAELMDSASSLGLTFRQFRTEAGEALQLHATFEALHAHHLAQDPTPRQPCPPVGLHAHLAQDPNAWHWRTWQAPYRDHGSKAVKQFAARHQSEILFHSFLQWLADRGLADAHTACRKAGASVGLIADLAVGTDSGGSHAWSHREDMLANLSVGAPPDLLNHQGQDWGLTSFSPHALTAHGYAPFLEMLRASLRHAGGLRIDHILGLHRLWLIPEGASPREGAYLHFPQQDLLNLIALESWRHRAIIIGEDLGTIPNNFRQHLAATGLLGTGVLWFEKEHGLFMDPARWRPTALATTTTHDLPTVAGWWRGRDLDWNDKLNRLPDGHSRQDLEHEREQERTALWAAFHHTGLAQGDKPSSTEPAAVVDKALAFIAKTPSPLTLAPVDDLLGLEEQANLPGTIHEHPNWRRRLPLPSTEITRHQEVSRRLAILSRYQDRNYISGLT